MELACDFMKAMSYGVLPGQSVYIVVHLTECVTELNSELLEKPDFEAETSRHSGRNCKNLTQSLTEQGTGSIGQTNDC